jgi:hypothetical protein
VSFTPAPCAPSTRSRGVRPAPIHRVVVEEGEEGQAPARRSWP